MNIEALKDLIKDYAKDTRMNLSGVLGDEPNGLSAEERAGVFLATAYATGHTAVIEAGVQLAGSFGEKITEAAKTAATLMAMNNVYYRFVHLNEDQAFAHLPAKLRMQGLQNHGVDKKLFELMCLAVSAYNGCGMCMKAHREVLQKAGVDNQGIQQSIRIAAVVAATKQALVIS